MWILNTVRFLKKDWALSQKSGFRSTILKMVSLKVACDNKSKETFKNLQHEFLQDQKKLSQLTGNVLSD